MGMRHQVRLLLQYGRMLEIGLIHVWLRNQLMHPVHSKHSSLAELSINPRHFDGASAAVMIIQPTGTNKLFLFRNQHTEVASGPVPVGCPANGHLPFRGALSLTSRWGRPIFGVLTLRPTRCNFPTNTHFVGWSSTKRKTNTPNRLWIRRVNSQPEFGPAKRHSVTLVLS